MPPGAYVYILYSQRINRYYIGSTSLKPADRLQQHNSHFYKNKFTAKGIPWTLAFFIQCNSRKQAEAIESHIKRMKSRDYLRNLMKYSEMQEKLLNRFSS
jgi:putative endonuclease